MQLWEAMTGSYRLFVLKAQVAAALLVVTSGSRFAAGVDRTSADSKPLSTGAIIGIVAAGIVALNIILGLVGERRKLSPAPETISALVTPSCRTWGRNPVLLPVQKPAWNAPICNTLTAYPCRPPLVLRRLAAHSAADFR